MRPGLFGAIHRLRCLIPFTSVLWLICLVAWSGEAGAAVRYVTPTGTGDCTSWDLACTLQTALTGAGAGDEIWVAAGTYKPSEANRGASFILRSRVAVYGGFTGVETAREQRNWSANPTILSGDIGVAGDRSDNSYHVVMVYGVDTTEVLDGFVITGGNANGSDLNNRGGGMFNTGSGPALALANITFSQNSAAFDGGGMYNENSRPTLSNVTFSQNSATWGGGMYNYAGSPRLFNVTFSQNSPISGGSGGALFNINSDLSLSNCILWGNSSAIDGYFSSVAFTYSVVEGGYEGEGNIDADPLFVDASRGDLRLRVGSPAMDAGSNSLIARDLTDLDGDGDTWEPVMFDLGGNPRIVSGTVDMGAYESGVYTLTYTAGAHGSLTGESPQTLRGVGNSTAVEAVPDTDYHFLQWSDGSTANPRTDSNVTQNISVTAAFAPYNTLTYTAGANGTLTGDVSQEVRHWESGTAVTAVPNENYHFVQWSDGSTANPRTDTNVAHDISVTAVFEPGLYYTLNYTAGALGMLTGDLSQTVIQGASGTAVTAVPDTHYQFVRWSDGSTANPRTDTNVMHNISVTAMFASGSYMLTYTAGANGILTGDVSQEVRHGESGTAVTAVPNTNCYFVQWSDGSTANPRSDTNVAHDISVTALFGRILYVKSSGATSGACKSWTNACKLQYALNSLAAPWDEIWVKAGTHKPCEGTDRSAAFGLRSGVAVYGGFAGGETAREQRNWAANQTILNGDIGVGGESSDNSYHVVTGNGADSTAVLDGFVITGGNADGSYPDDQGGGMYNYESSPTLSNVIFRGNSATYGGGMHNEGTGRLSSDHFTDSVERYISSSPTLSNVAFIKNSATHGGGMYNYYHCNPALSNVTFSQNSASGGGAMSNHYDSNPTLSNCILWGNTIGIDNVSSSPAITYSVVDGGYAGTGNIDGDPLFADASGENPRLRAGSPAIDTGNNGNVIRDFADLDGDGDSVEPVPFDLAGNPRIVGGTVDMGAYESTLHTLTYTAGPGGSISGETPQTVGYGGTGTAVTAAAGTDYHFVHWSDGSTANPRTDTNVTADISVTATFAANASVTHTVTPSAGTGGAISPNTAQTVQDGHTAGFTVTPDSGYRISNVTGCGGTLAGTLAGSTYTTAPITADCTVTATFASSGAPLLTVSIGPPSVSSTVSGPVSFTITYTGAASVNLTAGNITLNKTGTANGTISVSGGATTTPVATISGITGSGTLSISIAAGTASDAAGSTAPAAGPSAAFRVGSSQTEPGISQVSAGTLHTCVLRTDGSLICWGDNRVGQAPRLMPAAVPNGVLGFFYSQTFSFGPQYVAPSPVYTMTNGSLPPGLTFTGTGVSGTPTVEGTYSFTIRYTDANGFKEERDYTLTIATDRPVLRLPGPEPSYTESDPSLVIDATATVTDRSHDFDGGTLTVDYAANGTADDRLAIRSEGTEAGQIGVSGSTVTYGGSAIGTFSGGEGTTPLVITFNSGCAVPQAQALVRNITFWNVSEYPSTLTRRVRFVLTDGHGGSSAPAIKNVSVVSVFDPVNPPSDLTATTMSKTQIDLSWTDNSDNETGFKVFRNGNLVTTTAANVTSYSNTTGLSCGTAYTYEVRAFNPDGDSAGVTTDATTEICNFTPTIGDIPDQYTIWNIAVSASFTVGDPDNDPLTLSSASGNQTLIPDAAITFSGSGATRTVTLTPASGQSGAAAITVTVSDGHGGTASDSFVLTVANAAVRCVRATGVWDNGSAPCLDLDPTTPGLQVYTDVRDALAAAQAGEQIWVTQGTYKPIGGTDRTATFQLKNGVILYGGFAGTETSPSERNWTGNATVLSGDIGTAGSNTDNSYHVVTGSGTNSTAMLDGFTITGGNANGTAPNSYGGGMINQGGSPTLRNLTFTTNSADSGGGIYNTGSLTLTGVTFTTNSATTNGGGIYNYNTGSLTLTGVTFSTNSAQNGGGLDNLGGSATLTDVTFSGNHVTAIGGGMLIEYSNSTLTNVTFSTNSASSGGGGMFIKNSNPTLTNITFSANSASSLGGAIANNVSSPKLTNVTFSANLPGTSPGCVIFNSSGSSPVLANCISSGTAEPKSQTTEALRL